MPVHCFLECTHTHTQKKSKKQKLEILEPVLLNSIKNTIIAKGITESDSTHIGHLVKPYYFT